MFEKLSEENEKHLLYVQEIDKLLDSINSFNFTESDAMYVRIAIKDQNKGPINRLKHAFGEIGYQELRKIRG